MNPNFSILPILIFLLQTITPAAASSEECPLNFDYVSTVPWNASDCRNSQNATQTRCCQTLLSLYGISLSYHLKKTSDFHLLDLPTSISCLDSFQSNLDSLALPSNLTSLCLNPAQFVTSPDTCASIRTSQDWVKKLGPSTAVDSSCKPDLTVPTSCDACVAAGFAVQKQLVGIDGNQSHSLNCFYFTVLYAAGIVNQFGPESNGALTCIFGLPVIAPARNGASKNRHLALVLGLIAAGVAIVSIFSLLGLYLWRCKKCGRGRRWGGLEEGRRSESRLRRRPSTVSIWYKFEELEKATERFSDANFIGRGGFGLVYKGVLSDGTVVAVKKIIESDIEGNAEFCNEVEIISNLKHRNLVPLRGCCVTTGNDESNRYLVYDYMPNGNLDRHLFPGSDGRHSTLTWPQRKSIIVDVAKGLAYLHYGVKPAIYHRDIKATNILLDAEMRARVADFGLAKQSREGQSHLTTRVAGTHGYLAPEYALYGQLTEKSDVYSFGVVVLETLCGRKALDLSSGSPNEFLITDWAWSLVRAGKAEKALDASILDGGDSPKGVMERFLLVGILCAHVMVALRPTIVDALKMLEGDIEVPVIPDRPTPLGHPSFFRGDRNTFSISPALSALQLNVGDMLR
ncbi:probable receptor-like protein kinase At1g11050 [Andrographis paniculata]|uniref:probable receptor-like protein kinase At1g11050 n=1 Tax=Andrographis paniculata TaxID=175694 RepID=UPI0021E8DFF6|nr:probable receptor-like protein kinase At1g11050 [Andrographis paniculata]